MRGLGLWCLTLLSTLLELYCGDQFLLVEKTTDLPQATVKLYHTMLFRDSDSQLVIGTACTDSCKSTYHVTRAQQGYHLSYILYEKKIDNCNGINAG